jgi:TonB family protein
MKKTAFALIVLILALALPARADVALDIKLNFFGPAAGKSGEANVATSFYLTSIVQRNLQVKFTNESLLAELRKTFNAPDISLLASADLAWRSGGAASVMQIVQIDGRDYVLVLTPLPRPGAVNFKIGVVEEKSQQKIKDILLDTEIVLPDGEVAMLGFRDSKEKSYFIAFYVQGRNEEFGKDVVRLAGTAKPKLLKKVKPVYPKEALEKRIQGVVILEAVIDKSGKVKETRAVSSPDPLLVEAANEAVRQWEYEPFVVDGAAKQVLFTVTVTFALNPEDKGAPAGNALTRLEDSQKPKLVKMVKPVYPEEAVKNKLQGVVILEAVIDEGGKVKALRALKSPDPLLTEAAITAVKGWEYEPFIQDGKAKNVAFTVTVTFALRKD